MAVVTISVPDHIKMAFDKAYAGEDASTIIAALMWQAATDRILASEIADTNARRKAAIETLLKEAG